MTSLSSSDIRPSAHRRLHLLSIIHPSSLCLSVSTEVSVLVRPHRPQHTDAATALPAVTTHFSSLLSPSLPVTVPQTSCARFKPAGHPEKGSASSPGITTILTTLLRGCCLTPPQAKTHSFFSTPPQQRAATTQPGFVSKFSLRVQSESEMRHGGGGRGSCVQNCFSVQGNVLETPGFP